MILKKLYSDLGLDVMLLSAYWLCVVFTSLVFMPDSPMPFLLCSIGILLILTCCSVVHKIRNNWTWNNPGYKAAIMMIRNIGVVLFAMVFAAIVINKDLQFDPNSVFTLRDLWNLSFQALQQGLTITPIAMWIVGCMGTLWYSICLSLHWVDKHHIRIS